MNLNFALVSIEQGILFGIMALGVYIAFRILNFADLTVDGSFPLGAAVSARLIISGASPVTATLVAVTAGGIAGWMTGFLNTRLKITELLSGILTMTSLYSINLRVMGRSNIPLLQQPTMFKTLNSVFGESLLVSFLFLLLSCGMAVVLVNLFLRTQLGFALRASGDNPQMVRSLGVNTDSMKVLGLTISNAIVSFSGALAGQYMGFADVGMGIGTIVAGLASVIIGEVLIGDRGIGFATLGAVLGSVVYRLSISMALSHGFAASDLKLMTALLVVVALSTPKIKKVIQMG